MNIQDLVLSGEKILAMGRAFSNSDFKESGDIIVTDLRVLTQFGEDIKITKNESISQIQIQYLTFGSKSRRISIQCYDNNFADSVYFPDTEEWRRIAEGVFVAINSCLL